MNLTFNIGKFEKELIHKFKSSKINLNCPRCGSLLWKYSFDESKNNPREYCKKCDIDVVFTSLKKE